jgi:hypothetical protein
VISASIKPSAKVVWLENNGSQQFISHAIETGGDYAYSVAAADMDGDGDIDLLSAANDYTIAWHENDGQQNFTTHAILPANFYGRFVKPADIDGDGDMDMIAALRDRTSWLENIGGTFNEHVITTASAYERASLDVADMDADGDLDLVTAFGVNGEVAWYENIAGSFAYHAVVPPGAFIGYTDVRAANLDSDGRMDIFATSRNGAMAVYQNLGARVFTKQTLGTALSTIGAIDVADMNGDGRLDLLIGPGQWRKNLGNLQFASATFAPPGPPAFYSNVIAADLDRDGDIDTISDTEANETIRWYENADYGIDFTGPYPFANAESSGTTLTFQVARYGDESTPLAVVMSLGGTATVGVDYTVSGATLLGGGLISITIPANNYLKSFQITPLDDFQFELDETIVVTLVKQSSYVGEYALLPWTGATIVDDEPGDFGDAPAPYPTLDAQNGPRHGATGPQLGTTRDVELNGQPTPTASGDDEAADPTGGIVFTNVRAGQQNATVTVNVQNAPSGARLDAWFDFDRDTNWDGYDEHVLTSVLVHNGANELVFDVPSDAQPGQTFARFRLSTSGGLGIVGESIDGEVEDVAVTMLPPLASSGKFGFGGEIGVPGSVSNIGSADLDGDGDLDLIWRSYASGTGSIRWSENVSGDFTTNSPRLIDATGDTYSIADMDGDGDLDLVTASLNSYRRTYLQRNDGAGNFTTVDIMPSDAQYYVWYATTLADVDQDGDTDLLGSAPYGLGWLENLGSGQFAMKQSGTYGPGATGIPADLDHDGDLDFVMLGTNAWYENTSDFVFTQKTLPYVDYTINAYLVVDVDHDGYVDIVGTTASQNRLAWLRNNGNRTFSPRYTNFQTNPWMTAGDVDGDGNIDIVSTPVTAYAKDRGGVWFKNDGAGNFTQRFIPTGAEPYNAGPVLLADLDNDGDLDFVGTTTWLGDHAAVAWHENVSTSVTISVSPQAVPESGGQALTFTFHRDDSVAKLLTVNFDVAGDAVFGSDYSQTGAATFSTSAGTIIFPIGVDTVQMTVTPLGDAALESSETITLTLADGNDYVPAGQSTVVGTISDDEPGDFGDAPAPYATTAAQNGARHAAGGPVLGLLRDDEANGQPAASAQGDDAAGLADEDGVFFGIMRAGQTDATATVHVENAAAGARVDAWIDFNGDGNWDSPFEQIARALAVHQGDNVITFDVSSFAAAGTTYARVRLSSTGGLSPYGAANDGEVEDFAVVIDSPRSTSGTFAARQAVVSGASADTIAAGDLDSDGDVDLVGISDGLNRVTWYANNGQGVFTARAIAGSTDYSLITIADMDGDHDLDIVATLGSSEIRIYANDGAGVFTASLMIGTLSSLGTIRAADIDGDADMDLLLGGGNGVVNFVTWLENTGGSAFVEHLITDETGNVDSFTFADFDGDGDLDFATASSFWDTGVRWFKNDGNDRFTYHTLSSPANPGVIDSADLDGDGDIDLIAGGSGLWVYVNDGSGAFQNQTIASVVINSATVGDFDGDGDIDVLASTGSGSSRAWRLYANNGTGVFASGSIDTGSVVGRRAAAVADFNGDGALDFVSPGTLNWYRNLAPLPGDFSRDQVVDGGDYVLYRKTQGTSVSKFSGADANGDGFVGTADFNAWRAHFGQSSASAAASGNTATVADGEENSSESPQRESSQSSATFLEYRNRETVSNSAATTLNDSANESGVSYLRDGSTSDAPANSVEQPVIPMLVDEMHQGDVTTAAEVPVRMPPMFDSSVQTAAAKHTEVWRTRWNRPAGACFKETSNALLAAAVHSTVGPNSNALSPVEGATIQFSPQLSEPIDVVLTAIGEEGFSDGLFKRPPHRRSAHEPLTDQVMSFALAACWYVPISARSQMI